MNGLPRSLGRGRKANWCCGCAGCGGVGGGGVSGVATFDGCCLCVSTTASVVASVGGGRRVGLGESLLQHKHKSLASTPGFSVVSQLKYSEKNLSPVSFPNVSNCLNGSC